MSAGNGPMAVAVATAQLAGTGEVAIAVVGPGNWNTSQAGGAGSGAQGNLVSATVIATSTGAATLTLRIRQGTTTAGAQVGASSVFTFAGAAGPLSAGALEFIDASAFGVGPTQQGSYVLTAQASVGATVTPNGGVMVLETCAPVL